MDFFSSIWRWLNSWYNFNSKNLIICSLVKLKQSQDAHQLHPNTTAAGLANETTPPACDITLWGNCSLAISSSESWFCLVLTGLCLAGGFNPLYPTETVQLRHLYRPFLNIKPVVTFFFSTEQFRERNKAAGQWPITVSRPSQCLYWTPHRLPYNWWDLHAYKPQTDFVHFNTHSCREISLDY